MKNEKLSKQYDEVQDLFGQERYPEALVILERLIHSHPDMPDLLYGRALCLSRVGRVYEARQACNRLIHDFEHEKAKELKAQLPSKDAGALTATPPEEEFDFVPPVSEVPEIPPPEKSTASPVRLAAFAIIGAIALGGVDKQSRADSLDPAPDCPQCDKPMRRRTSAKGDFWGCSAFPDCKGTRPA